ncbi:aminotransferase class V-fold PLP-dependent enzyme [Candidatus Phytoplasma sp. AldY-WA1]|uniref:aminotransferase class V-fold PLP-dependent enzyme n=1 Tax=Candidatus Phytoplasma sp. AldY-WA1 TaxID=2852100 RepID=UPI00254B098E|nr:aminotransferase class V-fold PLP-dependent enzyme [Candidatus Phytoplasma sp. AldY-WA1]
MKNNDYRLYFPIFKNHKNKFIYFDSAATSLKPKEVIDAIYNFYNYNGLSYKSFGPLSLQVEQLIHKTRKKTAHFINASCAEEIIFTKGTTESLNILAHILSQDIEAGSEIITSELEHNSSILPWMKIANQKKAKLVFVPLNEENKITCRNFKKVLSSKTKIVALHHISNTFGYETPIKEIIKEVRKTKALIILDAAQSVSFKKIDVQDLDVDFMAFSAHKMYGPFGLGILFGKKNLLEKHKPFFIGGGSVQDVNHQNFTIQNLPYSYEAGTPNISSIIAFQKSLEFIQKIGLKTIQQHNKHIIEQINFRLKKIPQIKIFNPNADHIINFNLGNIHPHDVEEFLIAKNIYVRTGKHCADLAIKKINQTSTIRISVGIHNNSEDIDILIDTLKKINNFF